jgi:hypothetical protein
MSDDDKRRALNVDALRGYLATAFPGQIVVEFSPPDHGGMGFRIEGPRSYLVVVTDEYLDDLDPLETVRHLNQWDLAGAVKDAHDTQAIELRRDGLHVEPVSKY